MKIRSLCFAIVLASSTLAQAAPPAVVDDNHGAAGRGEATKTPGNAELFRKYLANYYALSSCGNPNLDDNSARFILGNRMAEYDWSGIDVWGETRAFYRTREASPLCAPELFRLVDPKTTLAYFKKLYPGAAWPEKRSTDDSLFFNYVFDLAESGADKATNDSFRDYLAPKYTGLKITSDPSPVAGHVLELAAQLGDRRLYEKCASLANSFLVLSPENKEAYSGMFTGALFGLDAFRARTQDKSLEKEATTFLQNLSRHRDVPNDTRPKIVEMLKPADFVSKRPL